jgi:hypothetical protein
MKKVGLAITDPMELARANYMASTVACGHLILALRGNEEFRSVMRQSTMAEEKDATRKINTEISTEKMEQILRRMPKGLSRSIRRGQLTSA